MLRITKGNLFSSECQTLVNTVNCVGVMGAGIALEFKLRYPEMFARYVEHCRNREIEIGKLWLYKPPQLDKQWVLNFPTKRDWKHPSKVEYLHRGLQRFVETYQRRGIQSIAFPILGSQNGKIPEDESVAIMARYLYECDVEVEIYRYSPDARDDLYMVLKQRFVIDSDKRIASDAGLQVGRVSMLRKVLSKSEITSIRQLATTRGIGERTLQRLLSVCESSARNGQLELDIPPHRNGRRTGSHSGGDA